MLLSSVDVIFADVAQPDQARIVGHNAQSFLKDGGHIVISIKASCIDSTSKPETIFPAEVQKLKEMDFSASVSYSTPKTTQRLSEPQVLIMVPA